MATSKKKKSAKQVKAKRGSASRKTANTKRATGKKSTVKKAAPKKKAAAKKTASKRAAPKKSAKAASKKAPKKAPKKKAAARGGRTAERPAQALHPTEPEERIKPLHHDMEDEPAPRRREPGEPVELGEEMEDELGDGLPLDDDEETEGDFLDKPEDLSSDEDTE